MASLRKINEAGLAIIEKREGLRLMPYHDSNGFPTVGWGHRIVPTDRLTFPLTQEQATALLRGDLEIAEKAVAHHVKPELNDNQFSALGSLCFNIGSGNFEHSEVVRYLNQNKPDQAADAILNWNHVSGKVNKWLTESRTAERNLFLTAFGDKVPSNDPDEA